MRAIAHLPRPGDIVELADMNLGKRRFRVKDVVHMYELLTEAPQYRNHEPARIVITVELVEGATAKPGYEGMT
jgi:hypothetical protein